MTDNRSEGDSKLLLNALQHIDYWITSPVALVGLAFQIWMLIDAIRRQEYFWAVCIFVFPVFSALLYFFLVYRPSVASSSGFELPGAGSRKRIRELQAQIHHLDKAHHHSQLGNIYLRQGKFTQAEQCYRAAMERDSSDVDTRAHFGSCLLRQNRPVEARPLLEEVCRESPDHDYGQTRMALAETLAALGERSAAIEQWKIVNETHGYAKARVQLAELYLAEQQTEQARALLEEVLHEHPHAPAFQRRRERHWMRRAKSMLKKI